MRFRWPRKLVVLFLLLAAVGAWSGVYYATHPLIFNESFWSHAHCMKAATLGLLNYADQHSGRLPAHPGGYGDALLLLDDEGDYALTGPGYDEGPLKEARRTGNHLPDEECGRVYIQGLTDKPKSGSTNVVVIFDKLPNPGDHHHLTERIFGPLGREVGYVDGHIEFIPESAWTAFVKSQIPLLVAEGIDPKEAERLYASEARR